MSTLRQVFQAADRRERRERQQRRKAPGNAEEEHPKHSPGLVANPYATAAAALQ